MGRNKIDTCCSLHQVLLNTIKNSNQLGLEFTRLRVNKPLEILDDRPRNILPMCSFGSYTAAGYVSTTTGRNVLRIARCSEQLGIAQRYRCVIRCSSVRCVQGV